MWVQTGPPSAQVRSRTIRLRTASEATRRQLLSVCVLARVPRMSATTPMGARSRREARTRFNIGGLSNQAGRTPVDEVGLPEAGPGDAQPELLRARHVDVDGLRRLRALEADVL